MTAADQSLAAVTSFLWDARVDAEQAARKLAGAANRLTDSALADHPDAGTELAIELMGDAFALAARIEALYDTWSVHRDAARLKDAS
jgi:hypothetical protein